jgi:hypothetical protein
MITKAQLEIENAKLKDEAREWETGDEQKRKYLTEFISGRREEPFYSRGIAERDETMRWPQIFFAIGKIMAQRKAHFDLEELRTGVKQLQEIEATREQKAREERENRGRNNNIPF